MGFTWYLHCLALRGTVLRHTTGVFLAQKGWWVARWKGPLNWVQLSLRNKILVLDNVTYSKYTYIHMIKYLSGWWLTYPSGKYESQLGI
jgi:hypothetical protein